jgi:hypothetical protein
VVGQEGRDRGDDPRPVLTPEGDHVGHGVRRAAISSALPLRMAVLGRCHAAR